MDKELKEFILSFKKTGDREKEKNNDLFKSFFNIFFAKFPKNNYEQACKMTFDDIMLSLFLVCKPKMTKDILEIHEKYRDYFKSRRKRSLLKIILLYFNDPELQELIRQRKESMASIFYMLSDKVYKYEDKNNLPRMTFVKLYNLFNKNEQTIQDFSIFSEIGKENIMQAFALQSYIEMFGGKYVVQKSKNRKQVIRDGLIFKESLVLEAKGTIGAEVASFLSIIYLNYDKALKSIDLEYKAIVNHNERIDKLINALSGAEEIKNIDYIMSLCPNAEAKTRVLDFIVEHNINSYESLIRQYESLRDDSDDSFRMLFSKYGYLYNEIADSDKVFLKNLGYEKVEEILNWFKKLDLELDLGSVSYISYEKLEIIRDLFRKGLLTKEFLKVHQSLWVSGNNFLQVLVDNITLCNNNGINILNYPNSLEILFSENLEFNFNILRNYDLVVTKATENLMFLRESDLEEKIEMVIEMGLLDNLKSLDILNKTFEELYKMKLFKHLGLTQDIHFYKHDDYFVSFASFLIDAEGLAILAKENSLNVPLPLVMQEYLISKQVLIINGIYVSVKRFLRNLGKFNVVNEKTIFYATIYGAYYTMEEIKELKNALISETKEENEMFRSGCLQ